MEKVLCGQCGEVIKNKEEAFYSDHLTEYFCDVDCATNRAFDYLRVTPVDLSSDRNSDVHFKENILYQK